MYINLDNHAQEYFRCVAHEIGLFEEGYTVSDLRATYENRDDRYLIGVPYFINKPIQKLTVSFVVTKNATPPPKGNTDYFVSELIYNLSGTKVTGSFNTSDDSKKPRITERLPRYTFYFNLHELMFFKDQYDQIKWFC
jgi:hypothetical protein